MELGVTVRVEPLTACLGMIRDRTLAGADNADLLAGLEEAQRVYLAAQRQRFTLNSRGGGEWPDLKPITKLKRFRDAGGRFDRTPGITCMDRLQQVASIPFPILYITGATLTSLVPGESNNIFTHTTSAVRAGTSIKHARYHQSGGGRLPQRRIINAPDAELIGLMAARVTAGLRQLINSAIREANARG